MSDTPRTDAVMGSDVWTGDAETWARNLERESAAQAERIRELEGQLTAALYDSQGYRKVAHEQATRAESSEQRLEKVEKALRELLESWLAPMPTDDAGEEAQNAWADRRAEARNNANMLLSQA